MSRIIFTQHARKQWACRFDDIGDAIEDEFAQAKPASPRVRQQLCSRSWPRIRRQKQGGEKPLFYVSRRCVFPALKKPNGTMVITTVYMRR